MTGKFIVTLLLAALGGCALPVTQNHSRPETIQFLLVNDVYVGEPMDNGLGGIARLKTLRDQLAQNGPVKLMLAGDFLFPSLLSKWYKGRQMIDYLNAARLDYATFGNHEFDDSRQTLVNRISESRFKWTSANCMSSDGGPMPGVSRWDTLTVSGVKFGIFGVTVLQAYPRWIRCGDPDSAVHAIIPELKAQGAEIIFGLTHTFRAADSTFLAGEPSIDFILGGHEHTQQVVQLGSRFVVKADRNAQTAQLVTLKRNGRGGWTRTHRVISLNSAIPADSAAAGLVSGWQDSLERRLGPPEVLATTAVSIDATNAALRRRETPFGDLMADAVRAGTRADVAALIGGSMRYDDEIPAGPVTNRQIESIFLFPDETRIASFPITGRRLREILEHSLSRPGAEFGGYLQLSGLQVEWDPARAEGKRIIGDLRRSEGAVIHPGDTLKFAINAYTACESGDGYSIPEAAEACARRESGPRAAQLIIDYVRGQKMIRLPALGRVRQVNSLN